MLKLRFLILIFLVATGGCATTPSGPKFSTVENDSELATLYIYRLYTPPYLRKPDIKIDDLVVVELPTDSYTVVRMKPGSYSVKSDWGFLDGLILNKSTTLSVEAGKFYTVNFSGKPGIIGTTVLFGASVQSGEANAIPIELKNCSFVAPKVQFIGVQ